MNPYMIQNFINQRLVIGDFLVGCWDLTMRIIKCIKKIKKYFNISKL